MRLLSFFALLCLSSVLASAQDAPQPRHRDKPADPAELASITARGRAIAAYDELAWHASDAVQAMHPPDGEVGMYIGAQTSSGLVMGFGHLNDKHTAFSLAFEVTPGPDLLHPVVKHNVPAIDDQGLWFHTALAFQTVKPLVKGLDGPYNLAILPAESGQFFVYAYPAQTTNNIFPTGADTRYLISAGGTTVLATHRMHMSLLTFDARAKDSEGSSLQSTYRTAVLDDAPEDTDVAIVLMMHGVPSMVSGKTFTYKIAADGSITYLMKTQDMLKMFKKAG